MSNLIERVSGWLSGAQKRLDPHSEQVLLNAGVVLPDGKRPPPNARTPEAALRCSAVYSPIKLLCETIASLPVRLVETDTKKVVKGHPVSRVLREPNEEQTLPEFLEMFLANYFTWGTGFAEVVKRRGQPVEIIPFAAGHTETWRRNGRVEYVYTVPYTGIGSPAGRQITLTDDQVLAFRMFGLNDSLKAFAPIWIAQRAIELALTQEQTATENFADGVRPDVIVGLPPEKALEKLSDLGPQYLKEESQKIQNQIAGARTRRELYLPFGYSATPYSANFQQAQFRETRDFQILEMARIWRVPPSKLGVIVKQPNASAEQDNLSFFQDTLRPVITKLEKRLERDLLTPEERGRLEIRCSVRAILRGDITTQTDQYVKLWQIGVYNRNTIRDHEDLPPIEGGDEYLTPVNMTTEQIGGADQSGTNEEARGTVLQPGQYAVTPAAERFDVAKILTQRRVLPALNDGQRRSIKGRKQAAEGVKGAFAEAIGKVVRKEKAVVMRDVKRLLTNRTADDLRQRLEALYSAGGELAKFVNANVQAPIKTLFDAIVAELREETGTEFTDADLERMIRDYVRIYVRDYASSSLFQLQDLMDEAGSEADIEAAFEARLGEWEEKRPEKEATQETRNGNSVFSKGLYTLAGIKVLRWIVNGPCPICEPLTDATFSVDSNHPVPPLHRGCECDLTSA